MLGAALTEGSLRELTISVLPAERIERQTALNEAREHLDPHRSQAARDHGATISYEQLVDNTLTEVDRLLTETYKHL
jgi:hypothetical protein